MSPPAPKPGQVLVPAHGLFDDAAPWTDAHAREARGVLRRLSTELERAGRPKESREVDTHLEEFSRSEVALRGAVGMAAAFLGVDDLTGEWVMREVRWARARAEDRVLETTETLHAIERRDGKRYRGSFDWTDRGSFQRMEEKTAAGTHGFLLGSRTEETEGPYRLVELRLTRRRIVPPTPPAAEAPPAPAPPEDLVELVVTLKEGLRPSDLRKFGVTVRPRVKRGRPMVYDLCLPSGTKVGKDVDPHWLLPDRTLLRATPAVGAKPMVLWVSIGGTRA